MPVVPASGDQPVTPAQRDAAIAALIVHREAGRLSSTEYEDRQVLADAARTWADLDALFVDLPAPHPQRPVPPQPAGPAHPDHPAGGPAGVGGQIAWGPGLVAALPILVLLLFFVTRAWQVFLLVPLVWIFTSGPGRRR